MLRGYMKNTNQAKILASKIELDYLLEQPEDQDFREGLLEPDRRFVRKDSRIGCKFLGWLARAGAMRSRRHD